MDLGELGIQALEWATRSKLFAFACATLSLGFAVMAYVVVRNAG